MAQVAGIEGGLAAAGSGLLNQIVDTALGPYRWTLNINAASADNTEFGASLTTGSQATALPDWNISFAGRFPRGAGTFGHAGLVTYASGYAANVRSWSMNLTWASLETTAFASTPPTYKAYIPGLMTWGGSYLARLDDTTAITAPAAASSGASATFRILDETNDCELSGNIIPTVASPTVDVAGSTPSEVAFTYVGDGALTQSDATTPLFPNDAAVGTADTNTITATVSSGRTYEGSAFLSSLSISVPIDGLIDVSGTIQGTGTLTIA